MIEKLQNYWVKKQALNAKLRNKVEAASSSYSAGVDFLQYIYLVLVTKNCLKIRSRYLVYEFSFKGIFNDINHGYSAATLKESS